MGAVGGLCMGVCVMGICGEESGRVGCIRFIV